MSKPAEMGRGGLWSANNEQAPSYWRTNVIVGVALVWYDRIYAREGAIHALDSAARQHELQSCKVIVCFWLAMTA